MREVTLSFKIDGASFEDDFDGELRFVLEQVRDKIHAQLERKPAGVCDAPEDVDTLRDINGNLIGALTVDQAVVDCPICGGEGVIHSRWDEDDCPECNGEGVVPE